jgi:hypothetical protein
MGWCLECHRAPEKHLRPLEEVYNMDFDAEEFLAEPSNRMVGADGKPLENQLDLGLKLKEEWRVQPKESCTTCHH